MTQGLKYNLQQSVHVCSLSDDYLILLLDSTSASGFRSFFHHFPPSVLRGSQLMIPALSSRHFKSRHIRSRDIRSRHIRSTLYNQRFQWYIYLYCPSVTMTTLRTFSFLLKIFVVMLSIISLTEAQVSTNYLTQNAKTIDDLRYVLGNNYKFLVAAYWRYMITSCEVMSFKMAADLQANYLFKFCMFVNQCPEIYKTQSCLVQYTALYIRTACCPVLPETTTDVSLFTSPTCVYGSVKPSTKIYGGINATLGEFPWVAMILRNGVFLCGSTIIDPTHVLTAAHCFDSYSNGTSYEIFAGRLTFNLDVIDEGQQRISIKSFTIHEGYNKQSAIHDLAVITLTSPLTITNYVTPACLPSSSDSVEQYCTVVGWGSTEDQQKPPPVLLKVRLQTYNATECLKTFEQTSQNIFTFVSANSICAANGTYGGQDACKGDSGGPLMCMKQSPDNSFRYLVFGIVSNGNGCALPGEPGVYTRVANYLDWIYDKIQQS